MKNLLTIREAAAHGAIPENALRRLVAESRIPVVKIGNRNYISLSTIKAICCGEQLNETEVSTNE